MQRRFTLIAALALALCASAAGAERKTVCSITVNSPDERETFRRYLPADQYDFVELVERGRPDWLAGACQRSVRCDVLLVSGHFDGGTEFYSDRLDARESLPIDELERASCSASCDSLFAQLKEVYLFGCNTLNAEALHSTSDEVARSLARSGHSAADIERLRSILDAQHGGSNRDVMRHLFKDVPVIYGFSGKAPLGRYAGATLDRYFQAGGAQDVATGRASARLLNLFAPVSMTVTAGVTDADPQAAHRRDVCQFADERLSKAQKLAFVHGLLDREVAEVRMFLDRIERYAASLGPAEWADPAVAAERAAIAGDAPARERYLAFARDTDRIDVGARMLAVARALGWLSPEQEREELWSALGGRFRRDRIGAAEIALACGLGRAGAGVGPFEAFSAGSVGQAAVLACLGNGEGHARVVHALTSAREADVQVAQVYLKERPLADPADVRAVAAAIGTMTPPEAQIAAIDTLARQRIADPDSLGELAEVFMHTRSPAVQRAIAQALIRSDYQSIASADLVRRVRQARRPSDSPDAVDILVRRLEAAVQGSRASAGDTAPTAAAGS